MLGNDILEIIYDILAQNNVTQSDRDLVTSYIDHIDYDNGQIVFKNSKGQLIYFKHEVK